MRVTKGVARYVASFTPPGAAFPDLVGSATDPYSANVALLLRMDGANGSTVFTDATGKTVIVNGNAQMTTAQSKSGGASAYFDGAGDFLQVADSVDFDLGAGDFTDRVLGEICHGAGGWPVGGCAVPEGRLQSMSVLRSGMAELISGRWKHRQQALQE